jgi:O-antigen/teichoic acid export membrane protein
VNKFRLKLKTYLASDFVKNSIIMINSAVIVQVIAVIFSLVLTRIYQPNDFGTFGILMALVGLVSIFSTFGYSNAILIAGENELKTLKIFCLKSVIIVSIFSLLMLFFWHSELFAFFYLENYHYFVYVIPILVMFNGIITVYNSLLIRYNYFAILSKNRILSALLSGFVSIGLGLLYHSAYGLIISYMITQIISSIFLFLAFNRRHVNLDKFYSQSAPLVQILLGHKQFLKFGLPTAMINNFLNQLPIFALSRFAFQPYTSVGHYNMTNRILGLPVALISTSIGDSFKQRALLDYTTLGNCRDIYIRTFRILFFLSIIPFSLIIFFGPDIFDFIFGLQWRESGEYARILGPMFLLRFLVSPLSSVFIVAQKQDYDFYLHILFIIMGFFSFFIGFKFYNSIKVSLVLFSLVYSLIYIVYFFLALKLCRKHESF